MIRKHNGILHREASSVQSPHRSSGSGTILGIITVVLLTLLWIFDGFAGISLAIAVPAAVAALFRRQYPIFHLTLFTVLLSAVSLFPQFREWPYRNLYPLLAYFVIVFSMRPLRGTLGWLRAGRFGKDIVLLCGVTVLLSGIALFVWYRAMSPDLSIHLAHMPEMPLWVFPLAGIGFALGNAAVEEFMFRGIVMHATDSVFGPGNLSVTVQAWLFAIMHLLRGFPNGPWGLAMAFVYGLMLGVIRRRSGGLLAPWAAHVCADIFIFVILAFVVLK